MANRLSQPHGPGTARGADLTHDVHDTADIRHNFGHGGPGFIHQGAALALHRLRSSSTTPAMHQTVKK